MTEPESVSGADVSKGPTSPEDLDRAIDNLDDQIGELRTQIHVLGTRILPQATGEAKADGVSLVTRLRAGGFGFGESIRTRATRWQVTPRSEWRPGQSIWWDVAALAALLSLAFALRFVHLLDFPPGIMGDEAQDALQGRFTWDEGWYGVWNPTQGGLPSGYFYLAAPFVKLFGTEVVSVRLLSATLDTLTVAMLYLLLRRSFGFGTAALGTFFYVTSAFAIQFAREGIPNALWPTLVVLGLVAVGEAKRSENSRWWALCGLAWGLAIYSYNGHSMYLAVLGVFLAIEFAGFRTIPFLAAGTVAFLNPNPVTVGLFLTAAILVLTAPQIRNRSTWVNIGAFLGAFLVAIYPMLAFISDNRVEYFNRSRELSVFRTEAWTSLSTLGQKWEFLESRYLDFWDHMVFSPLPDAIDGSGAAPFVPFTLAALAASGVIVAALRRPNFLVVLGVLTIAAAAPMTIWASDFALRRSLIVVPFVAMFAAIALVEFIRTFMHRKRSLGMVALVASLVVALFIGWRGFDNYFNRVAKSNIMAWTFNVEFVDGLRDLKDLPDDIYVYEWSGRWPWGMEVQTLLLPDTPGEWRGEGAGNTDLTVDYSKGRPVFMLFHDYQQLLPEIQAKYPGGEVIVGPPFWEHPETTAYTIYVLPEQP